MVLIRFLYSYFEPLPNFSRTGQACHHLLVAQFSDGHVKESGCLRLLKHSQFSPVEFVLEVILPGLGPELVLVLHDGDHEVLECWLILHSPAVELVHVPSLHARSVNHFGLALDIHSGDNGGRHIVT